MKNTFTFFFLLIFTTCISQTMDHVLFDYDNAGNQIKRHLIDIDPGKNSAQVPKDIKNLAESDLIKADIYDDIKYYPNPVKEELYLKWELINGNEVESISLYNLNGQLIKTIDNLAKDNTCVFPFRELPQAIYNLVLNCRNGEQKSLKIIKH